MSMAVTQIHQRAQTQALRRIWPNIETGYGGLCNQAATLFIDKKPAIHLWASNWLPKGKGNGSIYLEGWSDSPGRPNYPGWAEINWREGTPVLSVYRPIAGVLENYDLPALEVFCKTTLKGFNYVTTYKKSCGYALTAEQCKPFLIMPIIDMTRQKSINVSNLTSIWVNRPKYKEEEVNGKSSHAA